MKKLRLGLIGCGQIVRKSHAPKFCGQAGVTIAAAWSRRAETAGKLVADLGLESCRVYDSAEALCRAGIDAVVVATPSALHYQHARMALDAGKHVFLEKPMTLTTADADDLAAAAEGAGCTLLVNQSLRFNPGYCAADRAIRDGRIGTVRHVDCLRGSPCSPDQAQGWAPGSTWFVDLDAGGGIIFDWGVHMADVLRWFGGPVERVAAEAAAHGGHRAEDQLAAVFRFRNGATGTLSLSWVQPVRENRVAAYGSKGAVRLAGGGAEWSPDGNRWEPIATESDPVTPHAAFVEAVRNGTVLHDTVSIARDAVALCVALHRAAQSGAAETPCLKG